MIPTQEKRETNLIIPGPVGKTGRFDGASGSYLAIGNPPDIDLVFNLWRT